MRDTLDGNPDPLFLYGHQSLCRGPSNTPPMTTATPPGYVPRVAVDEDSLPSSAELNLNSTQFLAFKEALNTSPDELPPMFVCTTRLSVSGPGFNTININQADKMEVEDRLGVFPIRSEPRLAQKRAWDLRNMRFVLKNDTEEELFYIEIASDISEFDVYGPFNRSYGSFRIMEKHRVLFEPFARLESPVKPPCLKITPAVKFQGNKGRNPIYALPSYLGEYAIRFFSRSLRVHVIPHAALPNNVSRVLALNGAFCSTIPGTSRSTSKVRINFVVHPTSCECFCRAWRNSPRAYQPMAAAAERVCLSMQFCGCVLGSGMRRCSIHGEEHVHQTANGRAVCTGSMTVSMQCKHGPTRVQSTNIPLPAKDELLDALAVAAVDLCEECDNGDNGMDDVADTTGRTFVQLNEESKRSQARFEDELSSALLSEEDLRKRDETVAAMLCEGNYCFGKKPRMKSQALYLRDADKNTLDKSLAIVARSHAHLFPPA